MTDGLVVVGADGGGRRCLDIVQNMNDAGTGSFNILGVYDDAPQEEDLAKLAERGISYLGTLDDLLASQHRVNVVLGIGYASPRAKVRSKLMAAPFTYPTIIDPHANLGSHISLGQGGLYP